ncbi:thioredoxin [Limnoraphis robusta]|uniref:Thioredoxin n=1 Tax=Limnoraphis robusta CS-951 TaxID=1637645 RepID=A0A0F5YAK4_9CYAN|nr:thioredoxin [Limnoraphis robusta]KKD35991.1 thioredoxin [Limnoraphis robusta CS-951]
MSEAEKYITLTDENFEIEVLKSPIPVVVDFWAPWCGPCRVMNPIVSGLAAEFDGVVKVGKLNIDDYEELPTQYRIEAIPTLLFFSEGEVIYRVDGVVDQSVLSNKVQELVDQVSSANSLA